MKKFPRDFEEWDIRDKLAYVLRWISPSMVVDYIQMSDHTKPFREETREAFKIALLFFKRKRIQGFDELRLALKERERWDKLHWGNN